MIGVAVEGVKKHFGPEAVLDGYEVAARQPMMLARGFHPESSFGFLTRRRGLRLGRGTSSAGVFALGNGKTRTLFPWSRGFSQPSKGCGVQRAMNTKGPSETHKHRQPGLLSTWTIEASRALSTIGCPAAVALKSITSITPKRLGFSRATTRTASVRNLPRLVICLAMLAQRACSGMKNRVLPASVQKLFARRRWLRNRSRYLPQGVTPASCGG